MNQELVKPVSERRKAPRQKRAQQMVEKILDTTKIILRTEGLDYLSTHAVAEKGGIAVGTIYRYFPNKQALLLAIYEELSQSVLETCDKFQTEENLTLPKEEFFNQLFISMKSAELDDHIGSEIEKAIHIFPELHERDTQHACKLSEKIAPLLTDFGSKWPKERLQNVVKFIFCVDSSTWTYRRTFCDNPDETLQMELTAINSLLMSCFD